MIRVNLLRGRGMMGRFDVPSAPTARNSFVSGRELMLGGLFLLLGCVILFTQFKKFEAPPFSAGKRVLGSVGDIASSAPEVQSVNHAAREEPVELQATLDAPTTTPESQPREGQPESESAGAAIEAVGPEDSPGAPEAPPAEAAPVIAGEMRQLFASTVQGAVRIFVGTGTVPTYETFRLENPNRIVVDLPGVKVALPPDKLDHVVAHPQVQRVRAAQHRVDPPVARLVLDVNSFPKVEFFPQFNGLYIRVSENDE